LLGTGMEYGSKKPQCANHASVDTAVYTSAEKKVHKTSLDQCLPTRVPREIAEL